MTFQRVKFLAGAPTSASLEWREEGLLNGFSSALQRYLAPDHAGPPPTPASTQAVAKWRAVSLDSKTFYESPVLQRNLADPSTRLGQINAKSRSANREEDHDFLDYSFAVHADLQSSQIASQYDGLNDPETTFVTESSIASASPGDLTTTLLSQDLSVVKVPEPLNGPPKPAAPIMSVEAIPNAEYLKRLQPQTMTVNLIVGIISIAPARTVRIRKGGYDMEIIEVLVGDETKAGFTISSWHLPLNTQSKAVDDMRAVLQSLRPQDVVLIERVALSSFNGQVFGQSLNRKATKNTTTFTILHKVQSMPVDSVQQGRDLPSALEAKLERVKGWVSSFVGPGGKRKAQTQSLSRYPRKNQRKDVILEEEYLPPDSQ